MQTYRMLVLTDHHTHSPAESIYEMLRVMAEFEECEDIYLASRGIAENTAFFSEFDSPTLHARQVDAELRYSENGEWFSKKELVEVADFDVIFLRLDRPISDTQLLRIEKNYHHQMIINSPSGIIETGSKRFLLNFPELCPDIALCHHLEDVKKQLALFPIVLKPIHGYGGVGLIRIDTEFVYVEEKKYRHDKGMALVGQYLEHSGVLLSMRFLKNVTEGDKRVVVVDGKIQGATLRLPAKDSWLCNLKQGGSATFADIDESEYQISETVSPILKKHGVIIFGFDTLVDDTGTRILSEINTLNVGGFIQAQEYSGIPVVKNSSRAIWKYITENL